jgi:hypothetical protein
MICAAVFRFSETADLWVGGGCAGERVQDGLAIGAASDRLTRRLVADVGRSLMIDCKETAFGSVDVFNL